MIPTSWKWKKRGARSSISFDGTVLRNPYADRSVLFLQWHPSEWVWLCRGFHDHWYDECLSAVLAR